MFYDMLSCVVQPRRSVSRLRVALTGLAVLAAACAPSTDTAAGPPAGPSTSAGPEPSTSTTAPLPVPPSAPAASFDAAVTAIGEAVAARMQMSWRPGCPVPLDQLRFVTVTHWGFDGQVRTGELVVHADHAQPIIEVFRSLFDARFPIQQIRLVDDYGGDDNRSMAANNTSAFNCRAATGSTRWSEHAYGRAIDINPIQNPYVTRTGGVLPPDGAPHVTRDPATPGLITADGPVVAAFEAIGWQWGGSWSSGKDYQHFSATGR